VNQATTTLTRAGHLPAKTRRGVAFQKINPLKCLQPKQLATQKNYRQVHFGFGTCNAASSSSMADCLPI
jgi:hypothetical protein